MMPPLRITIVQTHPVQYLAPWFRHIAQQCPDIDLTVLYGAEPTAAQQGVGFSQPFQWESDLRSGYRNQVLLPAAPGRNFDAAAFDGVDVAGIGGVILATRPDVALVPGWHSRLYRRALHACRRAGVPVLYRGDTSFVSAPAGLKRAPWALLTRARLAQFDGFLSVGSHSRAYLAHFGAPEPLVFKSPAAVDNAAFAATAAEFRSTPARGEQRAALGVRASGFLVLFAGKLIAHKRPGDLVAAAAQLGPDVTVAIAGSGPLAEHLRAAAERAGVRVAWCGFLNESALRRTLVAADCLVVPSRSETWGLVVNEALASGTPAVVSDRVGCAPDLITERSGGTYPMGDVAALAKALDSVRAKLATGVITAATCQAAVAGHDYANATTGLVAAAHRLASRRPITPAGNPGHPRILAPLGQMVMISGMERMTFEVLRAQRERGAAVHCIVNRWDSSRVVSQAEAIGATWSTGYYRYRLSKVPAEAVRAAWDVLRTSGGLLRDAWRFRPTHLLLPEFVTTLRCTPALWLLRATGIPIVLRMGIPPVRGRFSRWLWRALIDTAVTAYAPNSRFIEAELLAHGVPRRKSRVILNTAPHRGQQPPASPRIPGRIIYVGQIIPPKGVLELLDAMALVLLRQRDATLDVVGDMDEWEPAGYAGYRQRVRDRAAEADLRGRVRLLGLRQDVPELMAAASLHCLPSHVEGREGFAVVTLEAKRAGIPSVVTPSGSLPETVTHGVDGWVCRDGSPAAIAEGLEYFLADPARVRQAGAAALLADQRYGRQQFTEAWSTMFAAERVR